jgi:hypothetical protein
MAPTNTVTATIMDQHIRNQMSIMAWGMAALCAWVLVLAAEHVSNLKTSATTPYNASAPITSAP